MAKITKQKGIVQFFLAEKGYGYIRVPATGEEFFVQRKHLRHSVQRGDRVRFEILENKQGLYAVHVEKLER